MLKTILDFVKQLLSGIFRDKIKELANNVGKKKESTTIETTTPITEEQAVIESIETAMVEEKNKPAEGNTLLELLDTLEISQYGKPNIVSDVDKPTLLLLDDLEITKMLYQTDIAEIKHVYNKVLEEDFKIVECIYPTAGPVAYDYIKNNKVDFAIFDITLGHILNINDRLVELDGIDMAYALLKHNPNAKFLLCTAHTVNNNHIINTYKEKIKRVLNIDFEDVYLNKNSDRFKHIYNLLYS